VVKTVSERAPRIEVKFTDDHRRVEHALAELEGAWNRCDSAHARRLLLQFGRDVRQHMRAEDDILFATFEAKTGLVGAGPTAALRREHVQIAQRLEDLRADLRVAPEESEFAKHLISLRALLADHWSREEKVVFPSCDQLFEDYQKVAAIRAIERSKPPR